MDIRDRIYSYLESNNLSQAAVARAAGLTPKQFNDILKGRATLHPEYVVPICKAMRCTPNELFGYGEEESP
ncbi:MAG: helix-turn-helix transcriptional regulator [Clostridiales bacterium]|nr:helix-turn-helix transcriptional regulator [Clostridiales bacterium]